MPRRGVEVYLYSFFNLGARLGVGIQRHAMAALPPGKTEYPLIGGWVGPRASLGLENLAPHRDSIPESLSLQQVAIPTELSRCTSNITGWNRHLGLTQRF